MPDTRNSSANCKISNKNKQTRLNLCTTGGKNIVLSWFDFAVSDLLLSWPYLWTSASCCSSWATCAAYQLQSYFPSPLTQDFRHTKHNPSLRTHSYSQKTLSPIRWRFQKKRTAKQNRSQQSQSFSYWITLACWLDDVTTGLGLSNGIRSNRAEKKLNFPQTISPCCYYVLLD